MNKIFELPEIVTLAGARLRSSGEAGDAPYVVGLQTCNLGGGAANDCVVGSGTANGCHAGCGDIEIE